MKSGNGTNFVADGRMERCIFTTDPIEKIVDHAFFLVVTRK